MPQVVNIRQQVLTYPTPLVNMIYVLGLATEIPGVLTAMEFTNFRKIPERKYMLSIIAPYIGCNRPNSW